MRGSALRAWYLIPAIAFMSQTLWFQPAVAEPLERPILFTVQPGFLKATHLRNLQDGWYPLLTMELHALQLAGYA